MVKEYLRMQDDETNTSKRTKQQAIALCAEISGLEIMKAMKEMFHDVIQTVMEVELDEELGWERCQQAVESRGTRTATRRRPSRHSLARWISGSPQL